MFGELQLWAPIHLVLFLISMNDGLTVHNFNRAIIQIDNDLTSNDWAGTSCTWQVSANLLPGRKRQRLDLLASGWRVMESACNTDSPYFFVHFFI